MRMIGQLPSEETANRFSDFLYVKGISNLVEMEMDHWVVWIHSEDELDRARELFKRFLGDPNSPEIVAQARKASRMRAHEEEETEERRERRPVQMDSREILSARRSTGLGRLTLGLLVVCIGVALLSGLGEDKMAIRGLFSSEMSGRGLPEARAGQVWRLITPIFIHFGPLHLIFNMLALVHLGGMIETRLGSLRFLALVLVLGVISNLGQYAYSGTGFGGMSGVIFGLAGYAWIKGRYHPESGIFLHPQSMMFLMIWFLLCLFGVLGSIANVAHAVGLAGGLLWGYLSCLRDYHRG